MYRNVVTEMSPGLTGHTETGQIKTAQTETAHIETARPHRPDRNGQTESTRPKRPDRIGQTEKFCSVTLQYTAAVITLYLIFSKCKVRFYLNLVSTCS